MIKHLTKKQRNSEAAGGSRVRDMQSILRRYGAWARTEQGLKKATIAAGFKGLLPERPGVMPCCDDDGLAIDGAMSRLKRQQPDAYKLLYMRYVWCIHLDDMARYLECSVRHINSALRPAEWFINGCLCSLDITLECD